MFRITNMDCIHHTFDTMIIALRLDKVNSLNQNSKKNMQICTMQQEIDSQNVQKHNKTIPICDIAGESKCNKHTL